LRTFNVTYCVSMPCADTNAGNTAASSSDNDAGSFTTAALREKKGGNVSSRRAVNPEISTSVTGAR